MNREETSHNAIARELLRKPFRLADFRGPQEAIIRRTLLGGHSLVILPTGGGKSLCFQIPALILHQTPTSSSRQPITLVLSPLISLMKDQVDRLQSLGVSATFINSSLDRKQREIRYANLQRGEYAMVYVTPERFRKSEFLEAIAHRQVRLLAIDEAHCISQWGHDFRPDYSGIARLRSFIGNPTTLCLTATATPDVQRDILLQAGLPGFGERLDHCQLFHEGIERPNLQLDVQKVWGKTEKLDAIRQTLHRWPLVSGTASHEKASVDTLGERTSPGDIQSETVSRMSVAGGQQQSSTANPTSHSSGIVYFTLIKTLLEFSEALHHQGIDHVCYHGDLPRQERKRIQEDFMQGNASLVLATNAFGMGVDKEDIRFVIHADVPGSMEGYYQEIGRAGRDGFPSQCLLLYDQDDLMTQMEFLKWSNPDADFYSRVYDLLLHERDSVRAFGMEWMQQRLCGKNRNDRRLETALAMLQRFGVIEDEHDLSDYTIEASLPETLSDPEDRQAKLVRDQRKLYAIVEFVQSDNRRQFLRDYFGIDQPLESLDD